MITAAQIRAARAMLQWTQDELCDRASIAHRTLARLETEESVPFVATLKKIQAALEEAGVVFQAGKGSEGISWRR